MRQRTFALIFWRFSGTHFEDVACDTALYLPPGRSSVANCWETRGRLRSASKKGWQWLSKKIFLLKSIRLGSITLNFILLKNTQNNSSDAAIPRSEAWSLHARACSGISPRLMNVFSSTKMVSYQVSLDVEKEKRRNPFWSQGSMLLMTATRTFSGVKKALLLRLCDLAHCQGGWFAFWQCLGVLQKPFSLKASDLYVEGQSSHLL